MMRQHRIRRGIASTFAAVVLTAGGCTAGNEPDPAPDPPAGYEQPPEDLCEQVRFEDVLQRWELGTPSWHTPNPYYSTERVWWVVRCGFLGQAEDGRFETKLEEFRPSGAVQIRVYHETADAVEAYDQTAHAFTQRVEEQQGSGGTTTEIAGWWDTGASLELAAELDPDNYVVGDFKITSLAVERLIRHQNLVARVYLDALSPTKQVDEASTLLEEIAAAMLNEAVEHLPRDAG